MPRQRGTFGSGGQGDSFGEGGTNSDKIKLKSLGLDDSDSRMIKNLEVILKEQKKLALGVAEERRKQAETAKKGVPQLTLNQTAKKYEKIAEKIDGFLGATFSDAKSAELAVKDLNRSLAIFSELDRKNNENLVKKVVESNHLDLKKVTRNVDSLTEIVKETVDAIIGKKSEPDVEDIVEKTINKTADILSGKEKDKKFRDKMRGRGRGDDEDDKDSKKNLGFKDENIIAQSISKVIMSKVIGAPATMLLDSMFDIDEKTDRLSGMVKNLGTKTKDFVSGVGEKAGSFVKDKKDKLGNKIGALGVDYAQFRMLPKGEGENTLADTIKEKLDEVKETLWSVHKKEAMIEKMKMAAEKTKSFLGKAGRRGIGRAPPKIGGGMMAALGVAGAGILGFAAGKKLYETFSLEIADFIDKTVEIFDTVKNYVSDFFSSIRNFFTDISDKVFAVVDYVKNSKVGKFLGLGDDEEEETAESTQKDIQELKSKTEQEVEKHKKEQEEKEKAKAEKIKEENKKPGFFSSFFGSDDEDKKEAVSEKPVSRLKQGIIDSQAATVAQAEEAIKRHEKAVAEGRAITETVNGVTRTRYNETYVDGVLQQPKASRPEEIDRTSNTQYPKNQERDPGIPTLSGSPTLDEIPMIVSDTGVLIVSTPHLASF